MEILRLIDSTALRATFDVPAASAQYFLDYTDLNTGTSFSASATSTSGRAVTFELDSYYLTYTGNLEAYVSSDTADLIATNIDVVKPYCDLNGTKEALGLTTEQIIECEKAARRLINSEAGAFGYEHRQQELTGMGIDYLPVYGRIHKLTKLWQNGELIFDVDDPELQGYKISIDKTSIVPIKDDKLESVIVWNNRYLTPAFKNQYDYVVEGDFGYRVIPQDVQEACELLIQDIVNDGMKFANRGIEEFDNREFRIKFAKGFNFGTGNLLADRILATYKNKIRAGVI